MTYRKTRWVAGQRQPDVCGKYFVMLKDVGGVWEDIREWKNEWCLEDGESVTHWCPVLMPDPPSQVALPLLGRVCEGLEIDTEVPIPTASWEQIDKHEDDIWVHALLWRIQIALRARMLDVQMPLVNNRGRALAQIKTWEGIVVGTAWAQTYATALLLAAERYLRLDDTP